jgi:hypothetical protein
MFQEAKVPHHYELRARNAKSLLQRLYRDVSTLVSEEVDLAKSEAKHRGALAMTAVRTFAFSIACGLLALICLTTCIVAALANVMSVWLAALIVGAAYVAAAFILRATASRALASATEPALSKLNVLLSPVDDGVTLTDRLARIDWTRSQVEQTLAALEHKTDLVAPMRDTALGLGSLGVAVSAIVRAGNGEHNERLRL